MGLVEVIARVGYAAKGFVYGIVGYLALKTAIGAGGAITDADGAVSTLEGQPFGDAWLAAVAIGLVAHIAWRVIQATTNPEGQAKPIERVGYAVSALAYVSLALAAGRGALGGRMAAGGDERVEWTARLLALPGGQAVVAVVGLVVIGVGIAQGVIAWKASFTRHYDLSAMTPRERAVATWAGRLGFAARGVLFAMVGAFSISAALRHDPSRAQGLGGSLLALAAQPQGAALLGVASAGLVAYGLYCLSCARWRVIQVGHARS